MLKERKLQELEGRVEKKSHSTEAEQKSHSASAAGGSEKAREKSPREAQSEKRESPERKEVSSMDDLLLIDL